ncbi:MAG: hypothetical protein LJE97_18500 [Betaproteobacteria bacterium]|jgi:hypothetical protein|nr:hypothetical protein [Betaproteobacteria bacterium]
MLDVYVGFMDEEVSSILAPIVDPGIKRNREVLVIERGRAEGTLFERHMRSYDVDGGRFVGNVVFGARADGLDDEVQQQVLARCLDEEFDERFRETLRPQYDTSAKNKTGKLVINRGGETKDIEPLFSVLRFVPPSAGAGTAGNDFDPIVVIRSPEMGFQPNLVGAFLRAVFRALLRSKLGAGKEFRVNVYGAGGAIGEKDWPGTLHDISGSVYVGSRIVRDAQAAHGAPVFCGIVSFLGCKEDSTGRAFTSLPLYESAKYPGDRAKAEEHAKAAFEFLCGQDTGDAEWRSGATVHDEWFREASNTHTKALHAEFQRLCSEKNKVSLTASFFVDARIKSFARALGLHDANMEDFHVLEVLKSLHEEPENFGGATLRGVQLTRVDCDPPEISPEVQDLFGEWTRNTQYTRETYLAALRWGLYGAQVVHLQDAARSRWDQPFHWSLVDRKEVPDGWEQLFYPLKNGGGARSHVLDPFFVEIATDFLASVNDGKLYGVPKTDQGGRVKDQSKLLPELYEKPAKKLKRLTRGLLKAFAMLQSGRPAGFLYPSLEDLLAILFARDNYVDRECPLIPPEDKGAPGEYEIWARPGSWEKNTSVLASKLKPSGAIVDRALYKSANQAALQAHAKKLLE